MRNFSPAFLGNFNPVLTANEDSKAIQQKFKSYPTLLEHAGELNELEIEVLKQHRDWLIEVNRTDMSKSYKMVVLKYMLSRGAANWYRPVTATEVAPFFYAYLMEKPYRRDADLADKQGLALQDYHDAKVAKLIEKMPLTKWSGTSKGLIQFEEEIFAPQIEMAKEHEKTLFEWMKEICEYRLHEYF